MYIPKISSVLAFKSNIMNNSAQAVQGHVVDNNIPESLHGGGEDCFIRQADAIDVARIKNLDIKNFRLVDSNSVRGVCLARKNNLSILEELKESGIRTVIDLRQEGRPESEYARHCENCGLEYFNFKLKENMPIFNPRANSKLTSGQFGMARETFVQDLDKFFKLMERGRVYMACLLGLHRTDLAVSMNYLLNPTEPQTPPSLSHMFYKDETNFTNKRIASVRNLIKNLTPENKIFLGLPENLDEVFGARVLKLRLMNLV